MVEGGEAWQAVMRREFPASTVTASSAADWKHTYLLQASNIIGELHCFLTRASFEEEVTHTLISAHGACGTNSVTHDVCSAQPLSTQSVGHLPGLAAARRPSPVAM